MYLFPVGQLQLFLAHVSAALPREGSGLLLGRKWRRHTLLSFVPTSSEENTPVSFRIRSDTLSRVAQSLAGSGTGVCGCAHSHLFAGAYPSERDSAAVKGPCTLWMIYSLRRRDLRLFVWNEEAFSRTRLRIIPDW
jgi:proteasome lid subunit RPN8/RPN11